MSQESAYMLRQRVNLLIAENRELMNRVMESTKTLERAMAIVIAATDAIRASSISDSADIKPSGKNVIVPRDGAEVPG